MQALKCSHIVDLVFQGTDRAVCEELPDTEPEGAICCGFALLFMVKWKLGAKQDEDSSNTCYNILCYIQICAPFAD